jgi:hypothetical protein
MPTLPASFHLEFERRSEESRGVDLGKNGGRGVGKRGLPDFEKVWPFCIYEWLRRSFVRFYSRTNIA